MANEITVTASLSAYKASVMSSSVGRALSALSRTMSGNYWIENTVLVPTSAFALPLGQVTVPGYFWATNLDGSNIIQLMNGASGAVFAALYPGDACLVPLDASCVPYAVALVASCLLEYLLLSR